MKKKVEASSSTASSASWGKCKRADLLHAALPSSHSCQRSGRSPALPYPLHEFLYFTTLAGGLIFDIKMGSFSMLKNKFDVVSGLTKRISERL